MVAPLPLPSERERDSLARGKELMETKRERGKQKRRERIERSLSLLTEKVCSLVDGGGRDTREGRVREREGRGEALKNEDTS